MKSFQPKNDLVREHFRRDGEPKKKMSEKQAKQMARKTWSNAYHCTVCDGWHIGGSK